MAADGLTKLLIFNKFINFIKLIDLKCWSKLLITSVVLLIILLIKLLAKLIINLAILTITISTRALKAF